MKCKLFPLTTSSEMKYSTKCACEMCIQYNTNYVMMSLFQEQLTKVNFEIYCIYNETLNFISGRDTVTLLLLRVKVKGKHLAALTPCCQLLITDWLESPSQTLSSSTRLGQYDIQCYNYEQELYINLTELHAHFFNL